MFRVTYYKDEGQEGDCIYHRDFKTTEEVQKFLVQLEADKRQDRWYDGHIVSIVEYERELVQSIPPPSEESIQAELEVRAEEARKAAKEAEIENKRRRKEYIDENIARSRKVYERLKRHFEGGEDVCVCLPCIIAIPHLSFEKEPTCRACGGKREPKEE